ncbi:zinc transporter ZIP10 [Lampris incognitus]|uniref:zinc transporter ZIP10 n=1 Tax=Lampris incognitus TaxID=2546036 RepID=UPI0024B54546|nr:zinc transporter ZIP10 [Lampris incognitus]
MRVQVHTKFCFLCVLTFLLHQCSHCHSGHHHRKHAHNDLQISQAPYVRGANPSPRSKSIPSDVLESEQHFYIQQLFRRYGKRDKLDFQGFQNLLLSLGLGEVKMVGLEHEDLGHDHVAHLDMLDVQEGLHSHSSAHEGHSHGYGYEHGHGRPSKKPGSQHHHQHPEQGPTQCSELAMDSSPAADSVRPMDHDNNQDHGNYNHDQRHDADNTQDNAKVQDNDSHGLVQDGDHTHDHDHEHDNDHNDEHDTELKHEQDQLPADHKDLSTHPKHNHSHHEHSQHEHELVHNDTHQIQSSTDILSAHQELSPAAPAEPSHVPEKQQSKPAAFKVSNTEPSATPEVPTQSRPKRPRKPAKARIQRGRNKAPSPISPPLLEHNHDTHDHNHGSDHSHSHKDKREAPGGPETSTPTAPTLHGHSHSMSHHHEECLNVTQLLTYYGLTPDSLISPSQFTYLCPALLYQIDSRVCIRHYHQMDVEQAALEPINTVWVWVWGFVSVTIISLLSLLGVVLVPILNQSCFKFLLTFLVALAVGTLSGDALLHLLPHAQGHDHSHSGKEEVEENLAVDFDGVWKGLTALSGIYLLFIFEHCIGMFKQYRSQGGKFCGRKNRSEDGKIGRKLSDHKLNRRSDAEWLHLKPLAEGADSTVISCDNGHNDTQLTELQTPDSPTNKMPLAPADPHHGHQSSAKAKNHGHRHSHGGHCHSDQEMKDAGIASIAWMVIMGDGMHNFSDGLAIGAAFSANITGGISTSVAVFCHELPHELGDFAVLLKAGMTVKQAIVYNLLSALMAYVGMVIGTAVGQYTYNVTNWIFAITAGMFLYVALVDMLPEMLHGDSEDQMSCQLGHFVLQNLGMLTGFFIMLLIAIFEDRIVFDFGF